MRHPPFYGCGRADRHHDVPRRSAADRPTVLLQPESKTTTDVYLQWGRPSTATVPAVWNIKLHMPSGADSYPADSYPADTDAADTDAADADSTLARTDAARTRSNPTTHPAGLATEAFSAGTGAPWHDLQRHMPCGRPGDWR